MAHRGLNSFYSVEWHKLCLSFHHCPSRYCPINTSPQLSASWNDSNTQHNWIVVRVCADGAKGEMIALVTVTVEKVMLLVVVVVVLPVTINGALKNGCMSAL